MDRGGRLGSVPTSTRASAPRLVALPRILPAIALAVALAGGLAACRDADGTGPAAGGAVRSVDVAEVTLLPDDRNGTPDPSRVVTKTVKLRHHWDHDEPGLGGRAVYTVRLPPLPGGWPDAAAIHLPFVGNQASIAIDGRPIARIGRPGDPAFDAGRQPQIVRATRADFGDDATPGVLTVDVHAQPLRRGGLGPVVYGEEDAVARLHQSRRELVEYAAAAYFCGLLLMGGVAAALWWREREAVYGCFALSALLGLFSQAFYLWPYMPVPWPWPGAIRNVAYGLHLALLARFILLALQIDPPWLRRMTYAMIAAEIVLPVASFVLRDLRLWNAALALPLVFSVFGLALVARAAVRTRSRLAVVILLESLGLVAAGAHDYFLIRQNLASTPAPELTPHAVFLFVLLQASLFVRRYSQSLADYRSLNRTLAERIARRETQLAEAFEALRAQREQEAVLDERQRIMRDIHDGVGSQLVGLLGLVARDPTPDRRLERGVRGALDEMRMAVDSLQPIDGDLTTLLGTLRYRLEPRLKDAGVGMRWEVGRLPPWRPLSPRSALHLQRIVLEAVTNVIRHARARTLTLRAGFEPESVPGGGSTITLALVDDGVGFDAGTPGGGHGLGNMQARARAIGAELSIDAAPGGGTVVAIRWHEAGLPEPAR